MCAAVPGAGACCEAAAKPPAWLPPVSALQTTPVYEELDARFYEALEARVERVEEALGREWQCWQID
jgi:hypothetical protein